VCVCVRVSACRCMFLLGCRRPKKLLEKDSLDSVLKKGTDVG